jgi:hypothetical protein
MADNFDEPIGDASEEAAGRPVSESAWRESIRAIFTKLSGSTAKLKSG